MDPLRMEKSWWEAWEEREQELEVSMSKAMGIIYPEELSVLSEIVLNELDEVCEAKWSGIKLEEAVNLIGNYISGKTVLDPPLTEDKKIGFSLFIISQLMKETRWIIISNLDKAEKDGRRIRLACALMIIIRSFPQVIVVSGIWQFFKATVEVLTWLLAMNLEFENMRDLACSTFLTIASHYPMEFLVVQPGEIISYIDYIFECVPVLIQSLSSDQIVIFYDALARIIAFQPDPLVLRRQAFKLNRLPLSVFKSLTEFLCNKPKDFWRNESLDLLSQFYRVNQRFCVALGDAYALMIGPVYEHVFHIYTRMAQEIYLFHKGESSNVKELETLTRCEIIRKDILKLIRSWARFSTKHPGFINFYITPFFNALHTVYETHPSAREPEVLRTMDVLMKEFGQHLTSYLPYILAAVFKCRYEEESSDEGLMLYTFILNTITECPKGVLLLSEGFTDFMLRHLFVAIHHKTNAAIVEVGLEGIIHYTQLLQSTGALGLQSFYLSRFLEMLDGVLEASFDGPSRGGEGSLVLHSFLLGNLLTTAEAGNIRVRLTIRNCVKVFDPKESNSQLCLKRIKEKIVEIRRRVGRVSSSIQYANWAAESMFELNQNIPELERHLRNIKEELSCRSHLCLTAKRKREVEEGGLAKKRKLNSPGGIKVPQQAQGEEPFEEQL